MLESLVHLVSEIATQKVCKLNSFMIRCFIDRRRNDKVSSSPPEQRGHRSDDQFTGGRLLILLREYRG